MNRNIVSALVLAAAAGSALAEGPIEAEAPLVSAKTRAEVQAELLAYRQAGVNPWSISYNPLRSFRSTASREQVVADYLASREQVRAFNGEDSGSAYLAQGGSRAATGTTLAGQTAAAR
jgi:hypothetical protein